MPLPHDLLEKCRRADTYPVLQMRCCKNIIPQRPDAIFRRSYIEMTAPICSQNHDLPDVDESRWLLFARHENAGRHSFVCELHSQNISDSCINDRFCDVPSLNQFHTERCSMVSSRAIGPQQRISRHTPLLQSGCYGAAYLQIER